MHIKQHHIGIIAIVVLSFFIFQLAPAFAKTSTTSSKSKTPITASSISGSTDATAVAAAKTALTKAATLKPVEGVDTSVVPLAQAIVDKVSNGVTVKIISSGNTQVASDGTITYGKLAANGKVTFTLTKNKAADSQSMSVVVPAQVVSDVCNVKDFGAKGDGVTDDTSAFKKAIATGMKVYIPDSDKPYIISDTLQLQNSIEFDGKIQMTDYHKNCLEVKNKVNPTTLYITNPQIDGSWGGSGCAENWGETGFYTGDNGHAISIKSSTNVEVEGGNLTNLGGDGIFLGIDPSVSSTQGNYSPGNIIIEGTVIKNPNRCCLGIEAGQNCSFTNVTGYKHNNYVAAIDVEPINTRPNATIDNLVFDNCNIVSDGSYLSDDNITQYGLSFPGKAEPFEIMCCSTAGHKWGNITVKNSTFVATNCMAVKCGGEVNLNYFTKNLTFDNCNFQSNYGGFFLWGKNITVKDCVANLTSDVYRSSTITDLSGSGQCVATVDNLKYNCLGDSQLFIYQMGQATVKNSEIVTKSVSSKASEIYSALFIRNCNVFTVYNCTLNSMRNALTFTGTNKDFYINNNTFIPNVGQSPYHYCVWARPSGTIDYSISGNVFDTSIAGTGRQMIESGLPVLKGDLATKNSPSI